MAATAALTKMAATEAEKFVDRLEKQRKGDLQKIVERENGEMELLVMDGRDEYRPLLVHDRARQKRARAAVIEGHYQRCVRFKPAPREAESVQGSSGRLGSRGRSR
jgi:hypothetical protein